MCDSLFLNFKFVVNRKSTSQTAFGSQLPYQGNVSKLAFIKNMKRLLHEIELTPNS